MNNDIVVPETKTCTSCNLNKDISEYRKERRKNRKVLRADCRECESKKKLNRTRSNPKIDLLRWARYRAEKKGREFNLTLEDIQLPEYCPVLGIKLEKSDSKNSYGSYSVDRIDSSKGYVKGNIQVISHRANSLKGNATVEELKKLLEYMRKDVG